MLCFLRYARANPASDLHQEQGSTLRDMKEWKQVTTWNWKRSCLPARFPLPKRCKALGVADEECAKREEETSTQTLPLRSDQPRPHSKCSTKTGTVKKWQQVVAVDDSILKGLEAPICRPDPLHRAVCCLPRAQIKDVTRKLSSAMQPSNYCIHCSESGWHSPVVFPIKQLWYQDFRFKELQEHSFFTASSNAFKSFAVFTRWIEVIQQRFLKTQVTPVYYLILY